MVLYLLPQTDTVCLGNTQESLRNETPCLHGSPAGNPWSFLYDYYITPPMSEAEKYLSYPAPPPPNAGDSLTPRIKLF